jgi:hypothetical protein
LLAPEAKKAGARAAEKATAETAQRMAVPRGVQCVLLSTYNFPIAACVFVRVLRAPARLDSPCFSLLPLLLSFPAKLLPKVSVSRWNAQVAEQEDNENHAQTGGGQMDVKYTCCSIAERHRLGLVSMSQFCQL